MDEDVSMNEVEDIMCDQVIISTEVDVDFSSKRSTINISATKLRLAVAILADTLLPTVVNVYYAYLRNQKSVVDNVRRQILPTLLAVLANYLSRSLSSVQRGITYPLTMRQFKPASADSEISESEIDDTPEKCVQCDVLSEPEEPIKADVIFIHGLHGSLYKTWRQGSWRHENHKLRKQKLGKSLSTGDIDIGKKDLQSLKRVVSRSDHGPSKIAKREADESVNSLMETEEESKRRNDYSPCWPREWLPVDCPGVRIIALNYTTDPYLWRPLWVKKRNRTSMTERSKEMIQHLLTLHVGKYPIIWVGHSKGGLFVKQILVDSWSGRNSEEMGHIYQQTKAILFYSVPHKGSTLADFNLPLFRKSVELTEIQRNCPFVLDLHNKFLKIFEDKNFNPEILSFIETSFTLMLFIYLKIVAYDSADPGVGFLCGVPLDHREICKPAGRDCVLYKELVDLVKNAIDFNGGQCDNFSFLNDLL